MCGLPQVTYFFQKRTVYAHVIFSMSGKWSNVIYLLIFVKVMLNIGAACAYFVVFLNDYIEFVLLRSLDLSKCIYWFCTNDFSLSWELTISIKNMQVHRACIEREIISLLDHPFLPTLYASFQVQSFSYHMQLSINHMILRFFFLSFLIFMHVKCAKWNFLIQNLYLMHPYRL